MSLFLFVCCFLLTVTLMTLWEAASSRSELPLSCSKWVSKLMLRVLWLEKQFQVGQIILHFAFSSVFTLFTVTWVGASSCYGHFEYFTNSLTPVLLNCKILGKEAERSLRSVPSACLQGRMAKSRTGRCRLWINAPKTLLVRKFLPFWLWKLVVYCV